MTAPRALIFDMDGVLIHSGAIHQRAFVTVLAGEDVRPLAYTEIAGMRTDEAFEHTFRAAGVALEPGRRERLVRAKRALALRLLEEERPLAPGCPEVLRALHGRGHRLALASSASAASVALFLRLSDTAGLFSAVLSGDSIARAKPDPEIFLAAADLLGAAAPACVVVEDSKSGVRAARRAGSTVLGVAGETSPRELLESGADRVIHRLDELLAIEL